MSSDTEKILKGILNEFTKNKKLGNCDICFDKEADTGGNHTGDVHLLKLIPKNGEDAINLVIKIAKGTAGIRKIHPIEISYKNEILIYQEVFPFFRNFLKENRSKLRFDLVPDFFFSLKTAPETLVFENVRKNGFKHRANNKPWDMDHALLSMKNYGKFHAVSFAIKEKKPEIFENWRQQLSNFDVALSRIFDVRTFYRKPMESALRILSKNGGEKLAGKFSSFYEEWTSGIYIKPNVEDEIVLIHGDCWNNNFLFKYDDSTSKPSKICFLDFQRSHIDSPVKDLSFNLYTTCDKNCLDHFDELLTAYHESFLTSLQLLDCKLEKALTLEQLREHWKKYGKYGLFYSILAIKISLMEKTKDFDFFELVEEGQAMDDLFESMKIDEDQYERRLTDVFQHFAETFM